MGCRASLYGRLRRAADAGYWPRRKQSVTDLPVSALIQIGKRESRPGRAPPATVAATRASARFGQRIQQPPRGDRRRSPGPTSPVDRRYHKWSYCQSALQVSGSAYCVSIRQPLAAGFAAPQRGLPGVARQGHRIIQVLRLKRHLIIGLPAAKRRGIARLAATALAKGAQTHRLLRPYGPTQPPTRRRGGLPRVVSVYLLRRRRPTSVASGVAVGLARVPNRQLRDAAARGRLARLPRVLCAAQSASAPAAAPTGVVDRFSARALRAACGCARDAPAAAAVERSIAASQASFARI